MTKFNIQIPAQDSAFSRAVVDILTFAVIALTGLLTFAQFTAA